MNILNRHARGNFISANGYGFPLLTCVAIVAGTRVNLFSYLAFLTAVIAIFLLSEEDSLCLLTFIMPFANIFKASAEAQSFFTYLMIVYTLCAVFRKRVMNWSFLVNFFLLVLLIVFQMFYNINILRTIKLLVYVLFIYAAMDVKTTGGHEKVFLFYVLGIIISSLIAALDIVPNLDNYVRAKELSAAYENESRFAGLYGDPNYYTVNVIISLCLVVILNHKEQLGGVAAWVFGMLLVAFAIMTYSKSAFLMLLLPFFMLLYSKIKRRNLLVFLMLVIAASILVFSILPGKIEVFDIILQRLGNDNDMEALTSGRYSLWDNYVKHLSNISLHTFIGAGLGAELINGYAAHNTYLDLLYYLGVVGTILLLSAIFTASKMRSTPPRRNILNYSVWLSVIALYFFLSELFYFDWSFHILMALLVYKTDMQQI